MKIVLKLRNIVDSVFNAGILIKAVFGLFEILGGIFIALSGHLLVNNFIIDLAEQEIVEDPHDLIANFLINTVHGIYYDAHFFSVLYLVVHGVINIFLVASLLRNKIKFYPLVMIGFSAFIVYQIYKYLHTFSFVLLFLTLFDIFIVLIIYLEYNRKKIGTKVEIDLK